MIQSSRRALDALGHDQVGRHTFLLSAGYHRPAAADPLMAAAGKPHDGQS
jgi:hypothetical protein